MRTETEYINILLEGFDAAVQSALPDTCLPPHLPAPPAAPGKTYVIGAGKAAAQMACVFEKHYKGAFSGTLVTRYGFTAHTQTLQVLEAAHPIPDEAGMHGAQTLLEIAHAAQEDDLVICLLSGGGSSLLTCPAQGVSFDDLRALNEALLKCGADIAEINCVRKHLNQAFGGKLAQAVYPARLITLAISDVAGDDPSTIASGPTIGDPTTLADARAVLVKYGLKATPSIQAYLSDPAHETPKPDAACFTRSSYQLIATPEHALQAAASTFKAHGFTPYILSSALEGDTNTCAGLHAALAQRIVMQNEPVHKPCVLLSGGETTVVVTGSGQGGPNMQFMLKALLDLRGLEGVYALACDTDGIDGCTDHAGAFITPDTLNKAKTAGLEPRSALNNNDASPVFEALGQLVSPGPTHTNVNDFRAFLIV